MNFSLFIFGFMRITAENDLNFPRVIASQLDGEIKTVSEVVIFFDSFYITNMTKKYFAKVNHYHNILLCGYYTTKCSKVKQLTGIKI